MKIKLERILMPEPVAAGMNPLVLMSLVYMLRSTTEHPPPVLVDREGKYFRIVDGRHRLLAHHIAGRRIVRATIRNGGTK